MRSDNGRYTNLPQLRGTGINNFPIPLTLVEESGIEQRISSDAHYALLTAAVEVYHATLSHAVKRWPTPQPGGWTRTQYASSGWGSLPGD